VTAIWVQPDAEYFVRPQRIIFEIPGELHREIMNPENTEEERRGFFGRAYREFALPAILDAKKHPMRHGFEVLDRMPEGMEPHDVQEDGADIVERTVKGVPKAAVTKAELRLLLESVPVGLSKRQIERITADYKPSTDEIDLDDLKGILADSSIFK